MNALIIGKGIAGTARGKVYHHLDGSNCTFVSRRESPIFVDDLYQSIDCVHVCTENASHFEIIQYIVQHHQLHVCVEFPMTNALWQTQKLYELAQENNCILHCAFISLLSESHSSFKIYVQTHIQQIEHVRLSFQGGMKSWLLEEHRQGNWGVLASSRLMSLFHIFGDLHIQDVDFEWSDTSYSMNVHILSNNIKIILSESRKIDQKRETCWYINHELLSPMESNTIKEHQPKQRKSLFMEDTMEFHNMITGKGKPYVSKEEIIAVHRMSEEIQMIIKNKYNL